MYYGSYCVEEEKDAAEASTSAVVLAATAGDESTL